MVPFGPVLVGQTEKTLQALLRHTLTGTGLSEPEWVTLRLATMVEGQVDRLGLISVVADRAKFADATAIVDALTERGLVVDGQPTTNGRELVSTVLAASEASSGTVWRDLPTDDVEAATRVLNEVLGEPGTSPSRSTITTCTPRLRLADMIELRRPSE